MNFEEKLAEEAFKKLTPEQIEKVAANAQKFVSLVEKDPSLLQEAGEKLGFDWAEFGRRAGMGAAFAGGGMAAMKGINYLGNKAKEFSLSLGKAKAYKDMLDNNPQLGEEDIDARAVQMHFDTLYRFNPEYAQDPLVAGAYVQNAIEMARPNLDTVNNLVNARKNMVDTASRTSQGAIDPRAVGSAAHSAYQIARVVSGLDPND